MLRPKVFLVFPSLDTDPDIHSIMCLFIQKEAHLMLAVVICTYFVSTSKYVVVVVVCIFSVQDYNGQ